MSDPNNPFQIIMQEKMRAGRSPLQLMPEKGEGWSILKIVGIIVLVLAGLILLGLSIWSLTVAYNAKSEAQSALNNSCSQGPPGQNGSPGPMGPQGQPGTFYFVGLGSVSGIYTGGCVKVPNENVITIPCTDTGYLVFDKRLPDSGKISDNEGTITVGQDGVYVVFATLDLDMNDSTNPVIVRVYKNNVIFGYYEFYQSGSQSFTFSNNYKLGDQIKIGICSEADNNQLVTHGSFVSILGG
jgi:hypothetical protein